MGYATEAQIAKVTGDFRTRPGLIRHGSPLRGRGVSN
jgi:hypothetical protein